jgi:hypothetical protein
MYGGGFNQGNLQERVTDNWINQNVPGGVNSKKKISFSFSFAFQIVFEGPLGEQLDNMMGGNPNPTFGQVVGGAPGVGGLPQYPGQYPGQYSGQFPGQF